MCAASSQKAPPRAAPVSGPAFIDAHCHLERHYFGDGLPEVMARARARGLTHFIAVGASRVTEGAVEALALAERERDVYAAIGIHPQEAHLATPEALTYIDELASHPKVVSIGEVGLDYYVKAGPPARQQEIFASFLALATRHRKPIMLHIREAHPDAWRLIDEVGLPACGGVVHCFTAGPDEAQAYLSRGMYLSIPGVVTFKNAEALREAVRMMPLDRMLLETDSPYLAPVPHRGKQNEPSFLADTLAYVANLRAMTPQSLAAICHANTCSLFNLTP